MNFMNYFKLASYLLVICGYSSLVVARFYSIWFSLLFFGAVYYSWKRDEIGLKVYIPRWLLNVISVGFLAYIVMDVFFRSGDMIGEGINFTVYLQMVRLVNPKQNRDWFQMYLLSFIHLVSAAVLTESVAFSVPFIAYIILATWTFTLYNMKVQYEEAQGKNKDSYGRLHESRAIITRRFLLVTSFLAIIVIATTMTIFFSFPRMSLGYFYRKISTRNSISGFSEQIELGSIGSIIKNSAVVMRVEPQDTKLTEEFLSGIYWRGTAFDNYDGRRWSRSDKSRDKKLIDVLSGTVELHKERSSGPLFVQKIFLEPMDTKIVFAADYAVVLRWEKLKMERFLRREIGVERDVYDTNYFFTDFASDQNYYAYSDMSAKKVYSPTHEKPNYPEDVSYLQLPYRDDRTARLTERVTRGTTNDYEKAKRIEEYLKANLKYSDRGLALAKERPIESFLFDLKRGHCELFSTAMAVMLRYAGIPSRDVVGFKGGNINELGNYIVVRQSDAHSWVEAYILGNGWMRFDPTPDSDERQREIMAGFGTIAKYIDYLKLRWNKYIIDYDLRTQSRYARIFVVGAGRFFGGPSWLDKLGFGRSAGDAGGNRGTGFFSYVALAVLSVFGVAFIVLRVLRKIRSSPTSGRSPFVTVLYLKMLRMLEKKGAKKKAWETPLEFSDKLVRTRGEKYDLAKNLTEEYYSVRFGGKRLTDAMRSDFEGDIKKLKDVD